MTSYGIIKLVITINWFFFSALFSPSNLTFNSQPTPDHDYLTPKSSTNALPSFSRPARRSIYATTRGSPYTVPSPRTSLGGNNVGNAYSVHLTSASDWPPIYNEALQNFDALTSNPGMAAALSSVANSGRGVSHQSSSMSATTALTACKYNKLFQFYNV